MQIAVLSGKGGAGKTFVSVNLAYSTDNAVYVDCDVEEPNGHLFLKPVSDKKINVSVSVPDWDKSKCISCRKCVGFCRYNALAMIKEKIYVFNEVCHSCGGCSIICPTNAITEKQRNIGFINIGQAQNVTVLTGCLNTGEVSGVPVIKKLLGMLDQNKDAIIDCPPGSACTVMESIKNADYCLLTTEPTLFGVHNMQMVYELVKHFNKPFGAIINKSMEMSNPATNFCEQHDIPIISQFPYDEQIAAINSNGKIAAAENKKYAEQFKQILSSIRKAITQ